VLGDRRQAMQASMASCQGSSSASGKSTSFIRILWGKGRKGERCAAGLRFPLPQPSPAPHLSTVRCRVLLVAGVSRLCINSRKGWGCRWSCSRQDLTWLSRGPSEPEPRACSKSTRSFPAGPKPSTRDFRAALGL
jgi:hypothetical protein